MSPAWNPDQRPASLLGQSPDGRIHLGNVRWGFQEAASRKQWQPQFEDATVDPSHVRDVYVCIEPFKPEWLAAHSFLDFEFDKNDPVRNSKGESDSGLVVSMEARLTKDQHFGLIQGMRKSFHSIYQVGTWSDSVEKDCKREGHKIFRYKLNLTDDQKELLLKNSLAEALKDRTNEYYNTLNNSCFTNVVRQVNTVLPPQQKMGEWVLPRFFHRPLSALPNCAEILLDDHRVLAPDPPLLTQPDKTLFPKDQAHHTAVGRVLARVSDLPFFHPLVTTGAIVAGAALGSLCALPVVGAVVGALAGLEVGRTTANLIWQRTHTRYEASESYTTPPSTLLSPTSP